MKGPTRGRVRGWRWWGRNVGSVVGRAGMTLISEAIDVELTETPGGLKAPGAFVWRGERYIVAEILTVWVDIGYPPGGRTRKWYTRRHRNYYHVRADDGQVYELYVDRGGGRRDWYLGKRLPPGVSE